MALLQTHTVARIIFNSVWQIRKLAWKFSLGDAVLYVLPCSGRSSLDKPGTPSTAPASAPAVAQARAPVRPIRAQLPPRSHTACPAFGPARPRHAVALESYCRPPRARTSPPRPRTTAGHGLRGLRGLRGLPVSSARSRAAAPLHGPRGSRKSFNKSGHGN